MVGDDDEIEDEDGLDEYAEHDPVSGKRVKQSASASVQLFVAEFRRRAKGLHGPELQAEVDRLLDRIIERHVGVAPAALRDELRDTLYGMLQDDPTIGAMLADLRAAAARESR